MKALWAEFAATARPLLSGLRLVPPDWRRAAFAAVASVCGVTAFIALLDALLFRAGLPGYYVGYYTSPLIPRMLEASLSAALDEVFFRLLVMTALVMLLTRLRGPLNAFWFVTVIIVVQWFNVSEIVLETPIYGTLRFWAVGCVWGWLYWRHGWLTALAGHSAVHLVLDPVLLTLLSGD